MASMLAIAPSAQAEGEPELSFGSQGFVRYEHSIVAEEPNIERGLHLSLRPDGAMAVLMQHRIQDSSLDNAPLIATFLPDGTLLDRRLFASVFVSPPDPPIAAASVDGNGRALFIGDQTGQNLALITALPLPPSGYVVEADATPPVVGGAQEYHRAVVGMPDGDIVVCGMRSYVLQATQTLMPMCRRLTAMGSIVTNFGNGLPIGSGVHEFFVNEFEIPGLQRGSVLAARLDSSGRILLGGNIRLAGIGEDLAFSARLLPGGVFDTSYCADTVCSDANASAPGWRADVLAGRDNITRSALIERPGDGSIAQVLDVRSTNSQQLGTAVLIYDADGALRFSDGLQLGEWTRIGFQLGVQSDGKLVIPLSYRPDAMAQFGAILRTPVDPATEGLFDPGFEYAPAGVTAQPGISVIRPTLPGGAPASSVECNAVLLQPQSITCAGLVRVGDAPLNVDMLLARVGTAAIEEVFDSGFE